MLVGGAAVRRCLSPAHSCGHSQTGVYLIFPSPGGRTPSLWSGVAPVWATCTLPGLWCCFDGIWLISRGGSARCTEAGGAGSAHFAVGGPLWEGPCSTGREAGRPVGGRDPQKHSVGCLRGASNFGDGKWFPLEFPLEDEGGKWRFPAPLFPL